MTSPAPFKRTQSPNKPVDVESLEVKLDSISVQLDPANWNKYTFPSLESESKTFAALSPTASRSPA